MAPINFHINSAKVYISQAKFWKSAEICRVSFTNDQLQIMVNYYIGLAEQQVIMAELYI